ncbi:unnamed protein product [Lactuca saligna]|uniref:UDP-glycosyltransferases domain-containing protein n=1 Tax=Lactuca saligna TaxID=75948 RepID=A0AA35Y6V8_LACSI|nr:unnamed protein product [Lactuca saligna]
MNIGQFIVSTKKCRSTVDVHFFPKITEHHEIDVRLQELLLPTILRFLIIDESRDSLPSRKSLSPQLAFGSQAEISSKQLEEISKGLEESQVSFLWVVRKCETSVYDELQERVGERGMIVREWVDQLEILKHESVKGFVSHCGWNSVLESICSEVPILAWPMMADQPLNARMVVEEIKIGLRVETCDGSVKGFVTSEGLKKMVKEFMEGEKGKEVRKKAKEIGEAAKEAMAEGGSSWRILTELIDELQDLRNSKIGDFPRPEGDATSATSNGEA